jgi:hypothetical protein
MTTANKFTMLLLHEEPSVLLLNPSPFVLPSFPREAVSAVGSSIFAWSTKSSKNR